MRLENIAKKLQLHNVSNIVVDRSCLSKRRQSLGCAESKSLLPVHFSRDPLNGTFCFTRGLRLMRVRACHAHPEHHEAAGVARANDGELALPVLPRAHVALAIQTWHSPQAVCGTGSASVI